MIKIWFNKGIDISSSTTSGLAVSAAGLDWIVDKKPIRVVEGKTIPNKFAMVRKDNEEPIGVVGNEYKAVQNRDAFMIADLITKRNGKFIYAGQFDGGERTWMLMDLQQTFTIQGIKIERNLLIMNSHNGSTCLALMPVNVNVVNNTTVNVATDKYPIQFKVKHTGNLPTRVKDINSIMDKTDMEWNLFEKTSRVLANKVLLPSQIKKFYEDLIPGLNKTKPHPKAVTMKDEIAKHFEWGSGNNVINIKGTAWAMFNGICEYLEYKRPTRTFGENKNADEQRTKAMLFGSGQKFKQAAFDLLISI